MNREFVFDSWYWIISIRYCIIRIITEQTLIIFPSNERKIIGHQIASIKIVNSVFKDCIHIESVEN